jgi:hypothetical protein
LSSPQYPTDALTIPDFDFILSAGAQKQPAPKWNVLILLALDIMRKDKLSTAGIVRTLICIINKADPRIVLKIIIL